MAQNDQNTGLQLQIPGMDQFKNLKFIQSEANPTDLVVLLPDGSEVVFPNYIPLAQAGAPPAITLEDGTVVPGQEIVSLIEDLDYDLIAPAAGNDVVGPQTGGGAGFSDPELNPDDDIGHGPYANRIEISDDVGFEQLPGGTDPDDDLGPNQISIYDNDGDTYGSMANDNMDLKTVFTDPASASGFTGTEAHIRPQEFGDFSITLETEAEGSSDWDGIRVQLRAGETINITHDPDATGNYFIGLDTDGNNLTGSDSAPVFLYPVGWEIEHSTSDGPITYLMPEDGFVYVGTGFTNASPTGHYYTSIEIDDTHIINGTSGNDTLVSGNDADYLNSLAGDDVLTGNGGNDVLVGGAGSDQYMYTDASVDGNDTIMGFDYNIAPGNDNDVINLDALFDALDISTGSVSSRDVDVVNVGGNTEITAVYDGATVTDFSITLDDIALTEAQLIANGNIVES